MIEPSPASSLGPEILTEFRALTTLLTPGLLAYFAAVFFIALFIRRTIGWVVKLVWKFGGDSGRRLARVKGILDLAVVVAAAMLAIRPLFIAVPLVLSIVVATLGLIFAIALPEWIQNMVAGLSLTGRAQFREGDQIEVGEAIGAVDRIGLQRTRLRAADGSLISLPNRDILRLAVRIGGEQRAVPVAIVLSPEAGSTSKERERAHRIARLSPFRRAGSTPRLEERGGQWTLIVQTWATADLDAVKQSLQTAIAGEGEHG